MVALFRCLGLVAFVLLGAEGARISRKRRASATTAIEEERSKPEEDCPTFETTSPAKVGELADVDGLYTFGAPGSGSPGLQHQSNADGIFPGSRAWLKCCVGGWVDIVASLGGAIWLYHPLMAADEIELDKQPVRYKATKATAELPSTKLGSPLLHQKERYHKVIQQSDCQGLIDFSEIMQIIAYEHSPLNAYKRTQAKVWTVVSYAHFDGLKDDLGEQYSYLLQNPDTFECILTFQGSDNTIDWVNNFKFLATSFCGLVDEDESCPITGFKACETRKPRGSFVHRGFSNKLREIVRTPEWRKNIQSNLGKCSSVYAGGQSLGGAVADLFTACVSQRLRPGDFGWEDYRHMYWTKGVSKAIDNIARRQPPK